jgi:hypothetical protein
LKEELGMTVQQIVQEAKRLPSKDRHRLVAALQETLAEEERRQDSKARDALKRFISMAGKAESAYEDVSGDKYKHLSDVYS